VNDPIRLGPNKQGEALVSTWWESAKALKSLKEKIRQMEIEVSNSAKEVALWALPKKAKDDSNYCFWVGGQEHQERLLVVSRDVAFNLRVAMQEVSQGSMYTLAETVVPEKT
jgi:hypothetical protein